jgi:general stress protein 26
MSEIDDLISNNKIKLNFKNLPRGVPFVVSDGLIIVRKYSSDKIQEYWKNKAIAYYNDKLNHQ